MAVCQLNEIEYGKIPLVIKYCVNHLLVLLPSPLSEEPCFRKQIQITYFEHLYQENMSQWPGVY